MHSMMLMLALALTAWAFPQDAELEQAPAETTAADTTPLDTTPAPTKPELSVRFDQHGFLIVEGDEQEVERFNFLYEEFVKNFAETRKAPKDIRVFQLVHVDVNFAAQLLQEMFNDQVRQTARANNRRTPQRGGQPANRGRQPPPEPEEPERNSMADFMGDMFGGGDNAEVTAAINKLTDEERIRVVANKGQNSLIIRARTEDFPDIIQLINKIDRPVDNSRDAEIVLLKHIDAEQAKTMVEQLLGIGSAATPTRRTPNRRQPQRNQRNQRGGNRASQAQQLAQQTMDDEISLGAGQSFSKSDVRISSLPERNSVVIVGPKAAREQIVTIIEELDQGAASDTKVDKFILTNADADSLAETLTDAYASGASGESKAVVITSEPSTNTLYVLAPPHLKDEIIATIGQADDEAAKLSRPTVIKIMNGDAESIAAKLNEVYASHTAGKGRKKIQIVGDKKTNQLFVQAPEEVMIQIKDIAAGMDVAGSEALLSRTYPLKHANATDVKDRMVDTVKMLIQAATIGGGGGEDLDMGLFAVMDDPRTNSIIVFGNPKTFMFVEKAIMDLDKAPPDTTAQDTRTIQLVRGDAREVAQNITRLFAKGNDGVDPPVVEANEASNAVLVSGTKRQIERVEAAIADLEKLAPIQETRDTKVYQLKYADPGQVANAINQAMGKKGKVAEKDQVTAVAEQGTKSVIVTAGATHMERIAALITELDVGTGAQEVRELVVVENAQATTMADTINAWLQQSQPRTSRGTLPVAVVASESTNTLIVSGPQDKVDNIKTMIARLDEEPEANSGRFTSVYRAKYANLWSIADAINKSFNVRGIKEQDRVDAALDWETGTLLIRASEEKHKEITALMTEIDTESESTRSFKVIKLDGGDASEVASTLNQVINAERSQRGQTKPTVTSDPTTNSLVLYASQGEVDSFMPLIESMNVEDSSANTPQRLVLEHADPAQLSELLTQIFTEPARQSGGRGGRGGRGGGSTGQKLIPIILPDDNSNSLIVRASEKDFQEIVKMVEELDVENEDGGPLGLRILQVAQGLDVVDLANELSQTIKDGEDNKKKLDKDYKPKYVAIGSDARTNTLLVTGSMAQFHEVEQLVRQLETIKPTGTSSVRVVKLDNTSAEQIKTVLDQVIEERSSNSSSRRGGGSTNRRGGGGRRRR